jgi:uncharacterized membrane protein YqiK
VGGAKAEAYKLGVTALGTQSYTAMQLAAVLGENRVKLVPDIAVSGNGGGFSGLAEAMVAKLLAGSAGAPATTPGGQPEAK